MPIPFSIKIKYNQKEVEPKSEKMTFYDELYTDVQTEDIPLGQRIRLTIHPKQDITLQNIQIDLVQMYGPTDRVFCNGYQSWSESREYTPQEQIPQLKWPSKSKWKYQGDYQNTKIKRGKGKLHSWTYTYIRRSKNLFFAGSLNEHTSFTIFQHDCQPGILSIQLDLDQLQLSHSYPAVDIVLLEGKETAVFDQYFKLMEPAQQQAPRFTGWTSWYNHYHNISETIILKNLDAFVKHEYDIDLFQIDDGWQQTVGDWLNVKASFPNGMGAVSKKIKAKGYKAGIWLAPFICSESSDLFKNKPQWLLKHNSGQPVKAGHNKNWGGNYYALDFYKKEVQDYLTSVFFTIFNKWGYDLAKLDFLYAACLAPPPHKTAGQVMCEAMDFIRKISSNRRLLACGVPLGAAFGRVDYCRIGGDVHLKWEDKWLNWQGLRERTSTLASLRSTLGRWQLDGRAFRNDPDVLILRKDNNKLSLEQQTTLALANQLLGGIILTSDYVGDYSPEQHCELQTAFNTENIQIKTVIQKSEKLYFIEFVKQNSKFCAYLNPSSKATPIQLKGGNYELAAHDSIVLKY